MWLLFWTQVLLTSGLALSFPFFALYLHRTRGVPMDVVGASLSLVLVGAAVSQGLGGELSDAYGRRRIMILALWTRAVLVLLLARGVARDWSVAALVAAHVAATFGGNFFDPAARGWVADHCPAHERLKAYGLLRVGLNLGWAVGPAVGGLVAGRSYAGMFLATSLACVLCAASVSGWIAEKEAPGPKRRFALHGVFRAAGDRRFALFCLWAGGIGLVMAQMIVPLSIHAVRNVHLDEVQVGLLFSLNGLIVVAVQYFVSRALSRARITTALAGGSLLYALGYGAVGFARSFAALAAAMMVISLAEIAVSPGLQALAANMAPENLKGRYLGFCAFVQQIGFAGGPLMGGFFLERLSSRWLAGPWIIVAAIGILSAAGFYSLRGSLRLEEEGLGLTEALAEASA